MSEDRISTRNRLRGCIVSPNATSRKSAISRKVGNRANLTRTQANSFPATLEQGPGYLGTGPRLPRNRAHGDSCPEASSPATLERGPGYLGAGPRLPRNWAHGDSCPDATPAPTRAATWRPPTRLLPRGGLPAAAPTPAPTLSATSEQGGTPYFRNYLLRLLLENQGKYQTRASLGICPKSQRFPNLNVEETL